MQIPLHLILRKRNKTIRIIEHILFWTIYFGFYILYQVLSYNYEFFRAIRDNILFLLIDILIAYIIIYLSDKYLIKQRYFVLIALSIITISIGVFLYRLLFIYIINGYFYQNNCINFWHFHYLNYLYGLSFPVALINILHLLRKWVSSQNEMLEIAKLQVNQELNYLKIQMNQHFLFNTLNNIDSLIYSDPETASQTIVNLSNLLRYSIYETNVQRVTVKKEIENIINFIELYELRLAESNKIELKISGNYDDLFIVPRLFIPFIENALIYGKKDDDSKIYLSITFCDKKVILTTMNQIKKIEYFKQGGVGINNVKRTLDLAYKNSYTLDITNKDNWFTVKLVIYLDDERDNEMYNC
ncbi:MAG: sensor histidine kinase [Bacteroidales bacterium]|nr:sensor histidine kinase [Bacteroidales bacterium]